MFKQVKTKTNFYESDSSLSSDDEWSAGKIALIMGRK